MHIQNWQLAHLFVTPDQYKNVAMQVAKLKNYSPEERNEFTLKERAIAFFTFDIYEHTLYQWRQANKSGDKGRAYFLSEVLRFLTSKTLRNPRLLYFWSKESENYEEWTHRHYKENVLNNPDDPLNYEQDEFGPFAPAKKTRR